MPIQPDPDPEAAQQSEFEAALDQNEQMAKTMLERAVRDHPTPTSVADLLSDAGAEGPEAERTARAAVHYAALLNRDSSSEA